MEVLNIVEVLVLSDKDSVIALDSADDNMDADTNVSLTEDRSEPAASDTPQVK